MSRPEDGAGPCDFCGSYTASKYGIHRKCEAMLRARAHVRSLRRLAAIVRERAVAHAPSQLARFAQLTAGAALGSGRDVPTDADAVRAAALLKPKVDA